VAPAADEPRGFLARATAKKVNKAAARIASKQPKQKKKS
jgi:hypothetical protein